MTSVYTKFNNDECDKLRDELSGTSGLSAQLISNEVKSCKDEKAAAAERHIKNVSHTDTKEKELTGGKSKKARKTKKRKSNKKRKTNKKKGRK